MLTPSLLLDFTTASLATTTSITSNADVATITGANFNQIYTRRKNKAVFNLM